MAYVFERNEVATFKFQDNQHGNLTLKNISGTETDANIIINGIRGLLWLVGEENTYDPRLGFRTITEEVEEDE